MTGFTSRPFSFWEKYVLDPLAWTFVWHHSCFLSGGEEETSVRPQNEFCSFATKCREKTDKERAKSLPVRHNSHYYSHYLSLPPLCMVCHLPYECVSDVLFLISKFRRIANVVFFLVGDSPVPEFYVVTFQNTLPHLYRSCEHDAGDSPKRKIVFIRRMKMEQSVPKRQHIKCGRRGITHKKEYNMWQTLCECNTRL